MLLTILSWAFAISALQLNGASPVDPNVQGIQNSYVQVQPDFIGRQWTCPQTPDSLCYAGFTLDNGIINGYVVNIDD